MARKTVSTEEYDKTDFKYCFIRTTCPSKLDTGYLSEIPDFKHHVMFECSCLASSQVLFNGFPLKTCGNVVPFLSALKVFGREFQNKVDFDYKRKINFLSFNHFVPNYFVFIILRSRYRRHIP